MIVTNFEKLNVIRDVRIAPLATLYLSASCASPEADDVDPFADIEEELEENEVVLKDC